MKLSTILFPLTFLCTSAIATTGAGTRPALDEKVWKEQDFVEYHCKGEIEHTLPDRTRIDCLNTAYAIEYDWGKKWAEAIGQSLYYAAMTNRKAGIVLIVNERTKSRYLKRIRKAIEANRLKITVWTVNKGDTKPPVRFYPN